MEPVRRRLLVETAFVLGVLVKGLDGLVELAAGTALLVLHQDRILALTRAAVAEELREDPHDLVAHLLLNEAAGLDHGAALAGGLFLLLHGVVKVAIVAALLAGSRRVYPWAVGALSVLLAVQLVQLVLSPGVGVVALVLLDALILALTWHEWRIGRSFHDAWRSVVHGWFPRASPPASSSTDG
ncbi:DUF2127 domain-containing protein [Promicromonospora sp. NPDC059942]|uniref:DUF2127 domain-containing protein n=1 Tax=Promicromonospora sp. NPDC059942 TaxID=3347009 RepID=UPI00366709A1